MVKLKVTFCDLKGNPTPKWTTLESCEPLSLGKASAGDHAIVNLGRLGHYQVNYSKSTLTALMESASETNSSVGVYDVAGLLIDTKIFSMRDPQSLTTFLELCQTLGVVSDNVQGFYIHLICSTTTIIRRVLVSIAHYSPLSWPILSKDLLRVVCGSTWILSTNDNL